MAGVKMNKNKTPNTGDFVNLHNPKNWENCGISKEMEFLCKTPICGGGFCDFCHIALEGEMC